MSVYEPGIVVRRGYRSFGVRTVLEIHIIEGNETTWFQTDDQAAEYFSTAIKQQHERKGP